MGILRNAAAVLAVGLVTAASLGCPGGPPPCRSSRDCPDDQACVNMACVARPPGPDTGPTPDAYLEYPDAVLVDDAFTEPDAFVAPDAFEPEPDAFAPPVDAGTDAFEIDPCTDGMVGGDESDVDCGGTRCPSCADGRLCLGSTDCTSMLCSSGRCGPPPVSCTNGVEDGEETAIDCGGPACPPCADGRACGLGRDCRSRVCAMGLCATPSCTDGAQNGTETDVDCGSTCPPCGDGRACTGAPDCQSGVCTASRCAAPSCTDRVRNGSETDLDCGGTCPGCAPGGICMVAADCASMECSAGVCLECVMTNPRWSGPPLTCAEPLCDPVLQSLRPSSTRGLAARWGTSTVGCSGCIDTYVLSEGAITIGASCPSCPSPTVAAVTPAGGSALDVTIRFAGCDPCTERLSFTGATVTSSGCTEAVCGPQAIRQLRAVGDRLELDWGDCACTQTLTFAGARTCS